MEFRNSSGTESESESGRSIEHRLQDHERRLRALEAAEGDHESELGRSGTPVAASGSEADPASPLGSDAFWALSGLKTRHPSPGAVLFTGAVDVGAGHVEYQWARSTGDLGAMDWADHAEALAALGHPLRLTMLRRLLDSDCTVAQFVDELHLGSTGVAYHHLNQLQAAGWVSSPRRAAWSIPATRVIALLAIITATEPA